MQKKLGRGRKETISEMYLLSKGAKQITSLSIFLQHLVRTRPSFVIYLQVLQSRDTRIIPKKLLYNFLKLLKFDIVVSDWLWLDLSLFS